MDRMVRLEVAVGTAAFRWLTGHGFFAQNRRFMRRRVIATFEVPREIAEELNQKVR